MTHRWRRKWAQDLETDEWSPLPLQVVSNGEYLPLSRTREQAKSAAVLREASGRQARRLGLGRREFQT